MKRTDKSFIYCEATREDLEERTRNGWEMVDHIVTLGPYGPIRVGYLLRMPRASSPLAKVAAELREEKSAHALLKDAIRDALGSACYGIPDFISDAVAKVPRDVKLHQLVRDYNQLLNSYRIMHDSYRSMRDKLKETTKAKAAP